MQNKLVKILIVLGVDWPWPSRSNSTENSKFHNDRFVHQSKYTTTRVNTNIKFRSLQSNHLHLEGFGAVCFSFRKALSDPPLLPADPRCPTLLWMRCMQSTQNSSRMPTGMMWTSSCRTLQRQNISAPPPPTWARPWPLSKSMNKTISD